MKLGTFVSLVLAVTSSPAFGRYSLDVNLDKGDGCYTVGEETACTATLLKDGKPAIGEKLRCTVKRERDVFRRDEFVCNGRPVTIKASMDRPGWLYFGFEIIGEDGNPRAGEGVFKHRAKPSIVGEIGAMYDPEEIKALDSRPADFDAYWDSCLRQAGRGSARCEVGRGRCPQGSSGQSQVLPRRGRVSWPHPGDRLSGRSRGREAWKPASQRGLSEHGLE